MPLDVLPDDIIVKTRDKYLELYLRSHQLRAPGAGVGQDSEPYVSGAALADQLTVQSENARQIGRSIPLASVRGKKLDALLRAMGLAARSPETGSQGALIANTSLLGSNIAANTELTDDNDQIFYVTKTALYVTGQSIPIAARSTGTTTNLAAGTVLTWSAPPKGSLPKAVVFQQSDGSGLSGGRLAETDDEVRNRISNALANPPAAGNDAAYQGAIEFSQGHGVAVQKAFTFPCALGPGTIAYCFTMAQATPGSSRLPNTTQVQAVADFITGLMPADDGIFPCILLGQPIDIVVRVTWADGADAWTDAVPWPAYHTTTDTPAAVVVTASTSPTAFTVDSTAGVRSGLPAPQIGNNIGFFDSVNGVFQQKRILTVTGSGPWALTVDTTNGVSDTTYTPSIGQRVCPWSDSLDTITTPVFDYLATMGPGEQFSSFFDPGLRQKRNPSSPRFWPSTITNRLGADVLSVDSVEDATIAEGLGHTTAIGTPGVSAYLIQLNNLSVFPL